MSRGVSAVGVQRGSVGRSAVDCDVVARDVGPADEAVVGPLADAPFPFGAHRVAPMARSRIVAPVGLAGERAKVFGASQIEAYVVAAGVGAP